MSIERINGTSDTADGVAMKEVEDCSKLNSTFLTHPVSEEEKSFPLAFSLVVYTSFAQVSGILTF